MFFATESFSDVKFGYGIAVMVKVLFAFVYQILKTTQINPVNLWLHDRDRQTVKKEKNSVSYCFIAAFENTADDCFEWKSINNK